MNSIRNTFFLALIAFILSSGYSFAASKQTPDLQEISRNIAVMMDRADYVNALPALDNMLEQAQRQSDVLMQAKARSMRGQILMVMGRHEEAYAELTAALDQCALLDDRKYILNDIRTMAYNGLAIYYSAVKGDAYLGKEFFLKAMDIALKANDQRMARIFETNLVQSAIIERDTSFLKCARDLYEWAGENSNPFVRYISACQLAQMYSFTGKFALAESLLNEAEKIGLQSLTGDRIPFLLSKADIYESKGDFNETLRILNMADNAINSGNEAVYFKSVIGSRKTGMYLSAKDYAKALECGKLALEDCEKLHQKTHFGKLLLQVSQAYEGLGDHQSALDYARRYQQFKDNAFNRDRDFMIRNLSALYEVEKKSQETEYAHLMLRKEHERNFLLILSIVFFAFALIAVLAAYLRKATSLKKIVSLNQQMAMKEKDLLRQLERLRNEIIEVDMHSYSNESPSVEMSCSQEKTIQDDCLDSWKMESVNTDVQTPYAPEADEQDKEQSETLDRIWTELLLLIEKTADWSEEDTSREAFASKLNTNRTYLSKAVKVHSGLTFSQFINSHRIRKAIEILSDPSQADYPLKALSQELGFKSINAFYSNFKAATGVSPGAFRKNA